MILMENDKIPQDLLVDKEDSGVDKEDCALVLAVVAALEENDKIQQGWVVVVDKEDCDMREVLDMYSVVVVSTLSVEPEVPCWENVVKLERL